MKFNEDFVPSTIDEAIKTIVEGLQPDEVDYIKKSQSGSVHFTTGMSIRNNWSFWEKDTPIHKDFKKRFNLWGMADDISGIILEGVWATINKKDVEKTLEATAEKFRKHWKKYKVDPETGEQL